jgi:hypothetical protein
LLSRGVAFSADRKEKAMNYFNTRAKPSIHGRSEEAFDRLMEEPQSGAKPPPPPRAAPPRRRGPRGPLPPPPNGYGDDALAEAGYAMRRVLDATPKLTSWGFCYFERHRGFDGGENDIYSLTDIKWILGGIDDDLASVQSHFRDRALMLSIEYLTRFIAARWSLRRRGRFLRTVEVNRTLTSSELMRIAEQDGEAFGHGVFVAAAIASGLLIEPIMESGKLAGDAWLNLAPKREWRG